MEHLINLINKGNYGSALLALFWNTVLIHFKVENGTSWIVYFQIFGSGSRAASFQPFN